MNEPIDVTVDSFAEGAGPADRAVDQDEQEEIVRPAAGPGYVIRENVPAIDENDPAPPRESDVVAPRADATMPDVEQADLKWKGELRDAVARWDRLTEDDVLALARHGASLTALVQKRHGLSIEEARRQVAAFIEDHQSFAL